MTILTFKAWNKDLIDGKGNEWPDEYISFVAEHMTSFYSHTDGSLVVTCGGFKYHIEATESDLRRELHNVGKLR